MTKNRRPPTRTARRLAAQKSGENEESTAKDAPLILSTETPVPPATLGTRGASEKAQFPRSTSGSNQLHKTDEGLVSKSAASPDADDLFVSSNLFEDNGEFKAPSKPKVKLEAEIPASQAPKEGWGLSASLPPEDSNCKDLFKSAKPLKNSSPVSFLDSQDDLFSSKKPLKRKATKPAPPSDAAPEVKDIFEVNGEGRWVLQRWVPAGFYTALFCLAENRQAPHLVKKVVWHPGATKLHGFMEAWEFR